MCFISEFARQWKATSFALWNFRPKSFDFHDSWTCIHCMYFHPQVWFGTYSQIVQDMILQTKWSINPSNVCVCPIFVRRIFCRISMKGLYWIRHSYKFLDVWKNRILSQINIPRLPLLSTKFWIWVIMIYQWATRESFWIFIAHLNEKFIIQS